LKTILIGTIIVTNFKVHILIFLDQVFKWFSFEYDFEKFYSLYIIDNEDSNNIVFPFAGTKT